MYELRFPPVIRFGWDTRCELGEILDRLGVARPLLVAIRRVVGDDGLATWEQHLGRTATGVFDGVPHDPPLEVVDAVITQIREQQADGVVAVGGGSVIDTAKAAAFLAHAPAPTTPCFRGEVPLDFDGLPFVALPTTAGTGAEITRNAVLTDRNMGVKKSIRSARMVPDAAVVDPALTVSCPPGLTAASGLDALTQAVECFISNRRNAASSALAREAVIKIMPSLEAACQDGSDRAAREAVAEGSLLTGLAFSQAGLGAAHGFGHPLGHHLNLAHGLTCAILLPHVLEWNLPACESRFADLANVLGLTGADAFLEAVRTLCRRLEVPESFANLGLVPELIPIIVAQCRSGSMAANPRPMDDAEAAEFLYRLAGGSGPAGPA